MAEAKIPMTPRGAQRLKEELKRRKEVDRLKIVKAIEEARGHGDLSENADYSAAKEAQSFNEGRIKELESMLALSNVIDPSTLSGGRVVFGATVKLTDVESGDEVVYSIVGEQEADIKKGLISITAPLARALIGREAGDAVTVKAPKGAREYEIVEVLFKEIVIE
jgi:transcription elongation factor GreA